MLQTTYTPVTDTDDLTEVAFYNMKQSEDHFDLQHFVAAQAGYFFANPTKTYQDLESELRKRNYNTHLIAKPPSTKMTNCVLGNHVTHKPSSDIKYECITSCRPKEYALAEVLESWPTYEANYEALLLSGILIVTHNTTVDSSNPETLIIGKDNNIEHLTKNMVKINYTELSFDDAIKKIKSGIQLQTGKEPEMRLYGMMMDGSPLFAFTVDEKIMSNMGICVGFDNSGHKKSKLIDIRML